MNRNESKYTGVSISVVPIPRMSRYPYKRGSRYPYNYRVSVSVQKVEKYGYRDPGIEILAKQ